MWYQVEGSKKHWTLKRQKSSYMRVLYNGKNEHTPNMGGFCNQNRKTRVQSCSEIQRLCQVLCEEVVVSSTETRKLSWMLWGRQAGCSKISKCPIPTSAVAAQSWQKVELFLTRCANECRWGAIIAIMIILSPPMVCLGSSCSHRVLTPSAVRELDTWFATCVQGLFYNRRSSELDSDCSLCTTQSKNQVLGHEVVVWTWLHR